MLLCVRSAVVLVVLLSSACVGPDAPDVEVCRDVIERFCAAGSCTSLSTRLSLPTMDCVSTLEQRTGCSKPDFLFSTPDRATVLNCRLPLVRAGETRGTVPSCDDADETVRNCPSLVTFLGGTP